MCHHAQLKHFISKVSQKDHIAFSYLTITFVFLDLSPNHMVDGLMLIVCSGILFLEVIPQGNLFH